MRHKILIVDDNQELLRLLARLMEAEGFEAVACNRGRAALEALAESPKPAVAVVDVLLPDMLGYEVGARLRKEGVPFLFMTGIFKGSRTASEARVQHGAAGWFEKPFEARRLVQAVRGLLPGAQSSAASDPVSPARSPSGEDLSKAPVVEPEEPLDALSLTGRVEVLEGGRVRAVIRGQPLEAREVNPPAPLPFAPPRSGDRTMPDPQPPEAHRSGPADEGELRDNLPELLSAFWLAQQTGELSVQRGKVKKAIYFESGRPCYAVSNLRADRFGSFLVRVGKLTAPQVELCEAAALAKGRRAGDVLVEMGILRETEKLYYVAQQLKAIAYSLFAWEEGRYRIHFDDRAAEQGMKLDLHPAHLIWRGVKKLYRPERLVRLLPPGTVLVPTQQPAFGLHEVELEPWEALLLPRVNGQRPLEELVALARQPEHAVRASLWALVGLEILAVASRP